MATSGSVKTNTAFGYVQLSWSLSSQSIENNTSTVAYTLSIYRSSNISSNASKSYSVNINGSTVASGTTTIGGSGTKTIKSGTVIIPHKADGTKTFAFSFSQQIDITWSDSWIGTVTGSGSGTLTTIPRATTPTLSASTVDMGSTVTVTMNRASSWFTHTLEYAFGDASGTIGTRLGTSATWTPAVTLAAQIPNATSGTATITCKTYNGSTLIGTKTVSIVLKVPSSVAPVINSVTRSEAVTSPDIASTFGGYVQHQSKIKIVTAATGAQSSTISNYIVTIRDANATGTPLLATYYGNDVTTDVLNWETTKIKIGVTVTDSRGRSASVSYDEDVLAYTPPKITTFSAFRSDTNGDPDYDSTNLKITVNFDIATVNNLNGKYYEILYKVKGASSWAGTIASGNIYTRNESFITSGIAFSGDNAYELRLNLYDTFKSAFAAVDIPTAFTLFDCRSTGKGIAFGKVSEADQMEIAMPVNFYEDIVTQGIYIEGQASIEFESGFQISDDGQIRQYERQTPTLLNSWVNYGAAYEVASYWKDSVGVVHLAGLIKSGTTTAETVIFTLPEGYRPRTSEKFFAVSVNAICVIDVYATGNVAIKTGANSGWLSLSGISFRAS